MYFEGLEAIPLIFSGCHEHNISEYKKALSWAQRNGYKSDIENLKREIAEEQGYIICPLAPETYTICNEECEKCEYMKDFEEALKERNK